MNWKKARDAGISFAFLKATQGTTILDNQYATNFRETEKAGILRGSYHFYDPRLDPIAQAKWFLQNAPQGELGHVLDAEALAGAAIPADYAARLYRFCDTILQATDQMPVIYTAYSFWTTRAGAAATWARKCDLWIANYNNTAPLCPMPWGPDGWEFWQFTSKGIGAIYGAQSKSIDLNVWRER